MIVRIFWLRSVNISYNEIIFWWVVSASFCFKVYKDMYCLFHRYALFQKNGHTGIPGLWTQELDAGLRTLTLDAGLWTLDAGFWTLGAGLWTLDTVVDCYWTKSEPSFWSCLIKLLKSLSMQISKDHDHTCSIETVGCDVAIFRNSILTLSVTL